MNYSDIKKLYYSIGEVSKVTGLKQYVLRYWETEFNHLNPQKNRAGNRIYKDEDIQLISLIKYLLYEKKYTIQGARETLHLLETTDRLQQVLYNFETLEEDNSSEETQNVYTQNISTTIHLKDLQLLKKIRQSLIEIIALIDD